MIWFCIDFGKVNVLSKFDAYPMPWVDELLDLLGEAQYITALDLVKVCWQIPLMPESQEKTAFITALVLYQFRTMLFGLHGTSVAFQKLMDQVLQPLDSYAAAYVDVIVIDSQHWEEHLV